MSFDAHAVITSVHNPGVKQARSLLSRKGRADERAFLVEGNRSIADMVSSGAAPSLLYVRDLPEDRDFAAALAVDCPIRFVSPDVFGSLSDVPHPQGVVAVVSMSEVSIEPRYDVWRDDFILVADGVRDPGNLGTLLRSAAGAGVTEVLVSPNSVDPFNPKCVRSAMGAHFLVTLRRMTWESLAERLSSVPLVAIADSAGSVVYDAAPWTKPCAIVVGSEAFGPNELLRNMATAYVRIPLVRGLESLNAGVAGSHLVLEAARQRKRAVSLVEPGFQDAAND